jgi:dTDP-4-amino-4,6-dideoxygalactose transaminase
LIEGPLREVIENGRITNFGKYVNAFEAALSAYLGTYVATVSSGTAGLIMALQALGVQPGDKVILPSFTFMATAQAILYVGGVPVFAEIDDDLTMSPADLSALLARHADVAAVLPVHTYGLPCQVDQLQAVVDDVQRSSKPIALLYDAAHAFGSARANRPVGGFGDAEVFSLSVTKVLVSVEGGIVSSRNPDLIDRIRRSRNYGIQEQYNASWPGLNGKMSELHAIVGVYNLQRIESHLAIRAQQARYYLQQLHQRTTFRTLPWPEDVTHTFKDFTILLPDALSNQREALIALLNQQGIETRAYFCPPVHQQHLFQRFADRPLPRTEAIARQILTIPFYTSITAAEIDYVVAALSQAEHQLGVSKPSH